MTHFLQGVREEKDKEENNNNNNNIGISSETMEVRKEWQILQVPKEKNCQFRIL